MAVTTLQARAASARCSKIPALHPRQALARRDASAVNSALYTLAGARGRIRVQGEVLGAGEGGVPPWICHLGLSMSTSRWPGQVLVQAAVVQAGPSDRGPAGFFGFVLGRCAWEPCKSAPCPPKPPLRTGRPGRSLR